MYGDNHADADKTTIVNEGRFCDVADVVLCIVAVVSSRHCRRYRWFKAKRNDVGDGMRRLVCVCVCLSQLRRASSVRSSDKRSERD